MPNEHAEIEDAGRSEIRKGIQSVEIGLRVVDTLVSATGPLPLKDVAKRSGLAGSAAHRYLVSLIRMGLATQTADGCYDLGGFGLRIGIAALSRLDTIQVGEVFLRDFVDTSGLTAMLSIWGERGPVVVRWLQGRNPVYTTIRIGSIMPLETSATGGVFAAYLRDAELVGPTAALTKSERQAFDSHRAMIREAGHAEVAGDVIPGLHALAMPVFNGVGDIEAVFTAVSAGQGFSAEARALLNDLTVRASANLGYVERVS
ncbi:MAG: IclR family transcriptional regulator [Sphingopyxis sp.]|nr:IclR family transcriptional regulator [Sphingopyxis sp.]